MGQGLAAAAIRDGHFVTLILGPVTLSMPKAAKRIDVETAAQMHDAVLSEFPKNDLLIMAAAVADYRPSQVGLVKIESGARQTIELEPTTDILAAAGTMKRARPANSWFQPSRQIRPGSIDRETCQKESRLDRFKSSGNHE